MSRWVGFAHYLYAALLCLYPRRFRDEFAAEMQETFDHGRRYSFFSPL